MIRYTIAHLNGILFYEALWKKHKLKISRIYLELTASNNGYP